jgi:hypothetical protein
MGLTSASLARAGTPPAAEPTSYVQADAFWLLFYGVIGAEGGYRIADAPIWAHAEVSASSMWWEMAESGSASQISAGPETHACSERRRVCGVLGLDFGDVRSSWHAPYDQYIDYQRESIDMIPRVVLDVGGKNIRFRVGLELYARLHDIHFAAGSSVGSDAGTSAKPVLGISYQW